MTTTIPRNSVGFSELLDHEQQESHRWHDWFSQHDFKEMLSEISKIRKFQNRVNPAQTAG